MRKKILTLLSWQPMKWLYLFFASFQNFIYYIRLRFCKNGFHNKPKEASNFLCFFFRWKTFIFVFEVHSTINHKSQYFLQNQKNIRLNYERLFFQIYDAFIVAVFYLFLPFRYNAIIRPLKPRMGRPMTIMVAAMIW